MSRYVLCEDSHQANCERQVDANDDGPTCNIWEDHEVSGAGRPYAEAIDEVFNQNELLTIQSAGNKAKSASTLYRPCHSFLDHYAIGLGRGSFTTVTVGALSTVNAPEQNATDRPISICLAQSLWLDAYNGVYSDLERQQLLQLASNVAAVPCFNYAGPTGDARQYPLLLGFENMCGVASMDDDLDYVLYRQFTGSSAGAATVGGAAIVLKEWHERLDPDEPFTAPMLRTHLLNSGDRSGFMCDPQSKYGEGDQFDKIVWHAWHGLPRHTGFGKVRLRLADSCHFNDGAIEYHGFTFTRAGQMQVIHIRNVLTPDTYALPADLSRFRIAVWFQLNSAAAAPYESTKRPRADIRLQKGESSSHTWEDVVVTYNGEEYTEYISSNLLAAGMVVPYPDLDDKRDPHANIAVDLKWPVSESGLGYIDPDVAFSPSPSFKGGAFEWRLVIDLVDLPTGHSVDCHVSLLWETGDDPSLAENRSEAFKWSCGSFELGSVVTGAGSDSEAGHPEGGVPDDIDKYA